MLLLQKPKLTSTNSLLQFSVFGAQFVEGTIGQMGKVVIKITQRELFRPKPKTKFCLTITIRNCSLDCVRNYLIFKRYL